MHFRDRTDATERPSPAGPLVTEIRSRLAREVSRPCSIEVTVQDGIVSLAGPVFDTEVGRLLAIVKRAPGVREVRHSFDVLTSTQAMHRSHRLQNTFGYEADFVIGHWAPWVRVLCGLSGGSLIALGIRKRGTFGTLASGFGVALLSRSIINRELTQIIGNLVLPVLRMRRTLEVSAPIDDVYEFWKNFSNYPKFMSFIQDVRINDAGGLTWIAAAPAGTRLYWDTSVLGLEHNQKIAWKSLPGSLIATEGVVRMRPTELQGTLMQIELSYAPPLGAIGYAAAHSLGFDPRSRFDEDLEVMKLLIEKRARETAQGLSA